MTKSATAAADAVWRERAFARGEARQAAAASGDDARVASLDLASARSALAHDLWLLRLEKRNARAAGYRDPHEFYRVRDRWESVKLADARLTELYAEAERVARALRQLGHGPGGGLGIRWTFSDAWR